MDREPYEPPTLTKQHGHCERCNCETDTVCVDCFMDSGLRRFVCGRTKCRDDHERTRGCAAMSLSGQAPPE